MPRKPSPVPTDVELELLKLVWKLGEVTVRDILEALPPERNLAYTTVMSMMRILEDKGYLTHRARDRAYVYRAQVSEDEVARGMIRNLINKMFEGSPELLMVTLLETGNLTEEQLELLRRKVAEAKQVEGEASS